MAHAVAVEAPEAFVESSCISIAHQLVPMPYIKKGIDVEKRLHT